MKQMRLKKRILSIIVLLVASFSFYYYKSQKRHPGVVSNSWAVLILVCDRHLAIDNLLQQVLSLRNDSRKFPTIVSQDCLSSDVDTTLNKYAEKIVVIRQPNKTTPIIDKIYPVHFAGYYKISRHYKWALTQVFDVLQFEAVIILEDDLNIAQDFLQYFLYTTKLLFKDPTLYCVSAWNDNGMKELIENDPKKLHRTDFFPGLGWIMTRQLWQELKDTWPEAFWDDWLRHPDQRKGRQCIRPEISRTNMSSHGVKGVSRNFQGHFIQSVHLNENYTDFSNVNLDYLLYENYDRKLYNDVHNAHEVNLSQLVRAIQLENKLSHQSVKVFYRNLTEFQQIAKVLNMIQDEKHGLLRTSYKGIVQIHKTNTRIYICPEMTE